MLARSVRLGRRAALSSLSSSSLLSPSFPSPSSSSRPFSSSSSIADLDVYSSSHMIPSTLALAQGILSHKRDALARAITLIESTR